MNWVDTKCGKTIVGSRSEHCPGCHQTFVDTPSGDAHRVDFRCLVPGELRRKDGNPRLELDQYDRWRLWRTPEQKAARAASLERLKQQRGSDE